MISVFIPGRPVPQGSKRYIGKGIMLDDNPHLKTWRHDIRQAILGAPMGPGLEALREGAVQCRMEFRMPRPASLGQKKNPPAIKRPDIDKLVRAVLDAVQSTGIIKDDSQVVRLDVTKVICPYGMNPGLWLNIAAFPWHAWVLESNKHI